MGESLSLAGWDQAALLPHNLIGSGRCEEDDVWAALWEVREPAAFFTGKEGLKTDLGGGVFWRLWQTFHQVDKEDEEMEKQWGQGGPGKAHRKPRDLVLLRTDGPWF